MESGKEKTVVVTTSRDVPKSQQQQHQQQQPLLLGASASSLSSSPSAAAIAAAQYLKQNSSSDILRQSFALKPNMPSSNLGSSSAAPRPIAPAPPGVLKTTTLPTLGVTNAANLTNVASIIRAPGAAGSPTSVLGYSGIVGLSTTNPRTVMMSPNTTGAHSLTAPGAILRYPLAQIPTARLPTAALAGTSTDPGGRFQVTIVPSRASPTSIPGMPGIVQLQTRLPTVTLPQQGHYVTALASSSGKSPNVTSSISTSQLLPQLTASLSQNQMLQQAQFQQIFQASKSASATALKGASTPQLKTDRVPVTTVCLVPNIVPIAKVYPQKQGAASSIADVPTSSSSSTNVAAATNAVISQILANRSGSSNATILPIQIQEQIQRQLISSGSIVASSGSGGSAPITQSVYLPMPIPTSSAAASALMASSSSALSSSKSSSIAALKMPASAGALTTVSATMLPASHASAINLGQFASASAAGVGGAAQFLPYYAGSLSGSTLQSLGVGSSTTTTASITSGRTSGPNQATTALLVSAAAAVSSLAGAVPVSVTSTQQPKKALAALPISTSTISPHHIAPGGGIYPALSHPLSSQQSIPILKVPNVPGNGTLAGMMAAAASHQAVNSGASAPVLIPTSAALAVSSAGLHIPQLQHQQQHHHAMALQPQSFATVSTPLTVLPLPRPILVSTTLSSVPFTNPNVSPRPSILRRRPETGATGPYSSAAFRVDSLTPQDRANLITAASAAAVRKGLFHTMDDELGGGAQALRTLGAAISPGRSAVPAMRETSSQSSTDSAQSDGGFEDEEMEEKLNSAFKLQRPTVTGPTDFQSALMMKPPIITQPSYHQQQQQQQQQSSLQQSSPQLEIGMKRPHYGGGDARNFGAASSMSATNNVTSDAEMSPRKRLRKQQLMTKNDSSSAAVDHGSSGTGAPSSVGGIGTMSLGPLVGGGIQRNLQTEFLQIGVVGSSADGACRASRQLSFQPSPNAPTASVSARTDAVKNGLKEAARSGVGWSSGITPPNVAALMADAAKGDESSLSSVGDEEEEDEEDGDGGDEGEYDPPLGQSRPALRKKNMSLLKTYHCDWSARLNHFQSWADVKIKEDKTSSVTDMANQKNMNKRCNGWRLYQVASQLEEVMEDVMDKHSKLVELQKSIKDSAAAAAASTASSSILSMKPSNKKSKAGVSGITSLADELRTVNELFEGNLQRCKLVKDQTDEAKDALTKVIDHQPKVMEIVQKHLKKRTIKHQPLG